MIASNTTPEQGWRRNIVVPGEGEGSILIEGRVYSAPELTGRSEIYTSPWGARNGRIACYVGIQDPESATYLCTAIEVGRQLPGQESRQAALGVANPLGIEYASWVAVKVRFHQSPDCAIGVVHIDGRHYGARELAAYFGQTVLVHETHLAGTDIVPVYGLSRTGQAQTICAARLLERVNIPPRTMADTLQHMARVAELLQWAGWPVVAAECEDLDEMPVLGIEAGPDLCGDSVETVQVGNVPWDVSTMEYLGCQVTWSCQTDSRQEAAE